MKIAMSLMSGMSYGGRTYFGNLLPALTNLDSANEYHFFVPANYSLTRQIQKSNVHFHEALGDNKSGLRRLLWEQLVLPFFLWRLNADVVYTAKNVNILLAPCKTVIAIRNVEPFYYREHQNDWKLNVLSWIKWQLTKLSVRKADAIVAVSKNNKRLMAEYFPGAEEKTYVVYNGNPVSNVTRSDCRERFILNASKFVAYANQLNLVEGYARLCERRSDAPPLKFAGGVHDESYLDKVKEAVARHGLRERVEFLGLVPQKELFEMYGRAHAFVFPSALESCPHTLIEVMTYGTPIATSSIQPMPEICENAAIYFDPRDREQVADALERICFDESARERSSAEGLRRHKSFTWENSAKGLKNVFNEVVGERKKLSDKMKIIVVSMDYPPQIRSISIMVQEFCESMVKKGHSVTVLTGWPRYGLSENDKKKTFYPLSVENGVRVVRVKTLPTSHVAYALRGVAQVMLPWLFKRALRRYVTGRIDAVVVYSPKLPLVKIGNLIKREHGARYLLNIQDLFPQAAIDLEILTNYQIIRFFERMEEGAYQIADAITTCTTGARDFLIEEKDVPQSKVSVVPNWIDAAPYTQPIMRDFKKEWGLQDDFVFVFPGNFGPSQGLEFVIEAASRVKDLEHVKFLFVGNGSELEHLQKLATDLGASNVIFKPFVSADQYPDLLKSVDVGLLSLKADCKTPAVPGKFFSFLAASLPVVAFLNPESEGHQLIKDSESGYTMVPGDFDKAEQLIRQVVSNQEVFREKGRLGHRYVQDHFSKEACITHLAELLRHSKVPS